MMIEARELAELLSRKPRWALKWIKSAVRVGMEMDLSSALEYETRCFEMLFSTADQKAGVQAFINKQKTFIYGIII
jgi:enoyl-CoA hydratase